MKNTHQNEKQIDWILDLYNSGDYLVLSYNTGDPSDYAEWIAVTMGVVVCYSLGLTKILKYKKNL